MQIELPFDINAETGVICTLVHNPDFILHSETLTPSYFYKKENGAIYWAIQELYQKGIDKIDEFNITTQINTNKGVKNIIESYSKDFVKELISNSEYVARGTKEEYQEVANRVTTLSFKRDTYNKLKYFQAQCLDDNIDLNQLNLTIMNDVDKLASQYIMKDRIPMYNKN
ncbi:MAG TPA: DnaB-like helicase N-terminal domain-containing protein, partial [Tissierellaceae bacterium]|nr:DnaB-like helicase N-terminal domain-containing protein [Tissierellaceae bacterium]